MALVNNRKLSILKKLSFLIFVFLVTLVNSVSALPEEIWKEQRQLFQSGVFYFNIDDDACAVLVGAASAGIDSDGSIWQSGLQPPYIVEQFALETLKALAQKKGAPVSDTVTPEHVAALVTFIWGEGGDINNPQLFNPMNTGLQHPELIDGQSRADGVQSFKSFDAGVEATARTFVGSNQTRLGDALTNPASTAEDFFNALTYWNQYPGNKPYAAASVTGGRYDENGTPSPQYYDHYIQLLQQVRGDYERMASTVLGTPVKEAIQNITDPTKLQFSGAIGDGGVVGTNRTSCLNNGGVVANNIAQTAVNLSWPTREEGLKKIPKPEYAEALQQFNPGARSDGADCGVFVATVVRSSGADPDYPAVGTGNQEAYVRANPDKYDVVDQVTSTAELQPGDIMIANKGTAGHTYIFVGTQGESGFNEASASLNQRTANLGTAVLSDSNGAYMRARLKR